MSMDRSVPSRRALWREVWPDFSWRREVYVRKELWAGLVGALLVIPQAITFAYLTGLPPEYGLYCAIFVAFLSSLLGNSALVGGPNTAVSILIGLTVIPYAGRGSPLFVEFVLVLTLMVGLLQLLIWLLRGAALFRYFSPAAITAIKVGVGVLLMVSGIEGMLGISPLSTHFFYEKFYLAVASWQDVVNPWAVLVSAVTVSAGLLLRRRFTRGYIALALLIGAVVGAVIYAVLGPVVSQLEVLGHVQFLALPLTKPVLGPPHLLFLEQTFPQAVAIAVLGLAQSLVIARDLSTSGDRDVDLHKECFAQGAANALAAFFSSFAGSGSFNRTSVAVELGARTPLAGLAAAVAVGLIAWAMEPVLTWMCMPAVAGVMILVGIGMIQGNDFRILHQRAEAAVFIVTLLTVLFLGLEVGIMTAVVASGICFVASAARVDLEITQQEDGERVAVKGNLFYASLDRLVRHLRRHPDRHTRLDLTRVGYCDATVGALLEKIRQERCAHGGRLEVERSQA